MSAENDVRKLTIDPGAIALARLFDQLNEQVQNCCGGGDNSSAKGAKSAATKTEQPKTASADDTAK